LALAKPIFEFDRQPFLATGQTPFRPIQHVAPIFFLTTRAALAARHFNKASSYPCKTLGNIQGRTGTEFPALPLAVRIFHHHAVAAQAIVHLGRVQNGVKMPFGHQIFIAERHEYYLLVSLKNPPIDKYRVEV
jgi:hypothetical protein